MTLGDIIEKFLGLFGVAPGPQRKLMNKISTISTKIAEMEESRNTILRTNTAIGEKIADSSTVRYDPDTCPSCIGIDHVAGLLIISVLYHL